MAFVVLAASAFTPMSTVRTVPARASVRAFMSSDLEGFLQNDAGIAAKFLPSVLAVCEEEMIGSVANLQILASASMLDKVFKPVVAASIEAALSSGASAAAGGSSAGSDMVLSLSEVRRRLMLHGQQTYGSEIILRNRLEMFLAQEKLVGGAHWDAGSQSWVGVPALAPAAPAPAAGPAPPGMFTVTMKNADGAGGELVAHVPPDVYLLDHTDELGEENEAFAELPYACRAGSCSACAAKVVSGDVDNADGSFLSAEQKAEGFVLTCTTFIKSDTVLQMHAEDDLF